MAFLQSDVSAAPISGCIQLDMRRSVVAKGLGSQNGSWLLLLLDVADDGIVECNRFLGPDVLNILIGSVYKSYA